MRHQLKWTLENLNSWKWRKKKCIWVCSLCWNVKTRRISWKACSASDREAQFTALRHKPAEKNVRWWLCTSIEREREREEEKLQAADQNHTSCNNKHPRDHSDIWTHCESLGVAHKRWGGGRKHISTSRSHFSFSGLKVEFWFQVEFGITTTAQKAIRAPQRRHWSWSRQQQKAQHKRTRSALNQTSWMKHTNTPKKAKEQNRKWHISCSHTELNAEHQVTKRENLQMWDFTTSTCIPAGFNSCFFSTEAQKYWKPICEPVYWRTELTQSEM